MVISFWTPRVTWKGLEEFEHKVDRIAQGEDSEDNTWLGKIYQQFKHLMKDEEGVQDNEKYKVEGLEPPMFDDTWGLADDFSVMLNNGKYKMFLQIYHNA